MYTGRIFWRRSRSPLRVQVLQDRERAVRIRILSPPTREKDRCWWMNRSKITGCFIEETEPQEVPPQRRLDGPKLRKLIKDLDLVP